MRRLLIATMALSLGSMGALPPADAGAQAAAEDSVNGTALACRLPASGCLSLPPGQFGTYIRVSADARSGPSGESPAGTVTMEERFVGGAFHSVTEVSCLAVTGNVAIIGVSGTTTVVISAGSFNLPIAGLIRVTDGGAFAPDTVEVGAAPLFPPQPPPPPPGPTDCSTFSAGPPLDAADDGGDLVVTDTPPLPSSKERCKNGGWRTIGLFQNQGDCVSFVATGGKNRPSGR
jgi:hypothetical protein